LRFLAGAIAPLASSLELLGSVDLDFERFAREREAEIAFLDEISRQGCSIEALLARAIELPADRARDRALLARRTLARRLSEGFLAGGADEVAARARNHRLRIHLWR